MSPLQRIDIDALKASVSLADVVGRRVKLRRVGRELVGLCPFHDERTPSFGVNDDKGMFHCFGCGANGDVVRFVMQSEGLSFLDAARWLGAGEWPAVDPVTRQAAVVADSAERLAKIADAKALWASAIGTPSTPAEYYLRHRGIVMQAPWSIRYASTWFWKDYETGECSANRPAMICAVQDVAGQVVGVQRVFIDPHGRGKFPMSNPKRSLGRIIGCALRLGPPATDHVIVCEGPEDGLTLSQCLPAVPVWVAMGTSVMPLLELPDSVRVVTLAGDNNAPGRAAVDAAAAAFTGKGLEVRTMFPDAAFADFNDELRNIRK
ncbi:CHC2 zinc finger domain-containing protein [Polymorphobacter fuscus]|uniref:DNA primase n=1 Tax=Sandarakinorhabdus fusca TaxID=1439888 RepID=A0A7C9GQU4_9SPHN|nr:CHC2 zinc finger domain-containing protein [Polymorphobacter fuscus]KAB7645549.1 DNA primase [Polymorphobacter fuscus]MQT17993.1 DNA primase [Polymorphobacter fuscus]NJC08621.1 DNA primase [Polymorphobacter fuscus]